jgi:hypothetical protein
MKLYALFTATILLITGVWIAGHRDLDAPVIAPTSIPVEDVSSFILSLQAAGAAVESDGALSHEFLSVEGLLLKVNGEDLQVFEYADADAAQADAARISADGFSVGNSMISWVDTPHFFRAGRVMAVYIGENQEMIASLEATLGKPFAGVLTAQSLN